jgi:hypothetical protein
MKSLVIPILLIVLGIGWLLTTLGLVPQIDWVWTLGVALTGILVFVICGFDKVSVTVGPFFLIASGLSVLRQTGRLAIDLEIPVLVIAAGMLMLVAHLKIIPAPKWLIETRSEAANKR